MSQPGKVKGQQAFVLHAQPYKETSLLVEMFTREHGRVGLVARGARRPRAGIRALLLPFSPLEVGWFGKSDIRTLSDIDWQGGLPQLASTPLVTGFYVNELILKLVARDDPHEGLFDDYRTLIAHLARGSVAIAPVLRRFELQLLAATGYAPTLDRDLAGEPVRAEAIYGFVPGEGARPGAERGCEVSGQTLLALDQDTLDQASAAVLREARFLNRALLTHALAGTELASRALLNEVAALSDN